MTQNKSAVNAMAWSLIERFSHQAIAFLIGIVLARLLSPYDFGVVGLISIFIALSNVFIDSGFANGLIRKMDRSEKDLSTTFYFNVIISVLLYILLWVSAPIIAMYFEEPVLVHLIRICGLSILFHSLCIVQRAVLTIRLDMKSQTIVSVFSQIPAGIIAIFFAFNGFGVYSLAIQTVISAILQAIFFWFLVGWRPRERFDSSSFKYLWNFGSKLLGATLIGTLFDQIYSVLIGKYIGKTELGYFTKSKQLTDNVTGISSGVINKVALPVLSKYQNSPDKLCEMYRKVMRILIFFMAPLTSVLCFASDDIIIFLWTEKWLSSALLFQLLILCSVFIPIGQLSLILMQVVGRTGLILKLEFPKKAIYCCLILIGFLHGVIGLCIALIGISITGALINMYATKKIVTYNYRQQLLDIFKYMVLAYSLSWASTTLKICHLHIINFFSILISTIVLYSIVLLLFKDDIATLVLNSIKNRLS